MKKVKRITRHKQDYYDDVSNGIDVIEANLDKLEQQLKSNTVMIAIVSFVVAVLVMKVVMG